MKKLVFDVQGNFDAYYLFEVNSDYQGFSLYHWDIEGWREIVPPLYTQAINEGGMLNHLKVIHTGEAFTLEINGLNLGTWSDAHPSFPGRIGLAATAYQGEPNVDARFDNFKVTYLVDAANNSVERTPGNESLPAVLAIENFGRIPKLERAVWPVTMHP
jgi:hypothetical protein